MSMATPAVNQIRSSTWSPRRGPSPRAWPEEIALHHVLEHLGHDPRAIGIMLRVRKSQDGA
jgi:hypothetical protein